MHRGTESVAGAGATLRCESMDYGDHCSAAAPAEFRREDSVALQQAITEQVRRELGNVEAKAKELYCNLEKTSSGSLSSREELSGLTEQTARLNEHMAQEGVRTPRNKSSPEESVQLRGLLLQVRSQLSALAAEVATLRRQSFVSRKGTDVRPLPSGVPSDGFADHDMATLSERTNLPEGACISSEQEVTSLRQELRQKLQSVLDRVNACASVKECATLHSMFLALQKELADCSVQMAQRCDSLQGKIEELAVHAGRVSPQVEHVALAGMRVAGTAKITQEECERLRQQIQGLASEVMTLSHQQEACMAIASRNCTMEATRGGLHDDIVRVVHAEMRGVRLEHARLADLVAQCARRSEFQDIRQEVARVTAAMVLPELNSKRRESDVLPQDVLDLCAKLEKKVISPRADEYQSGNGANGNLNEAELVQEEIAPAGQAKAPLAMDCNTVDERVPPALTIAPGEEANRTPRKSTTRPKVAARKSNGGEDIEAEAGTGGAAPAEKQETASSLTISEGAATPPHNFADEEATRPSRKAIRTKAASRKPIGDNPLQLEAPLVEEASSPGKAEHKSEQSAAPNEELVKKPKKKKAIVNRDEEAREEETVAVKGKKKVKSTEHEECEVEEVDPDAPKKERRTKKKDGGKGNAEGPSPSPTSEPAIS